MALDSIIKGNNLIVRILLYQEDGSTALDIIQNEIHFSKTIPH